MTERLNSITAKIASAERGLARLHEEITRAEAASGKLHALIARRNNEYGAVFEGIAAEANELAALYRPLEEALKGSLGALGNLAFTVRRSVDLDEWVSRGETLMDLRKVGRFRGHGQLRSAVRTSLLTAWERGTRQEVSDAMARFRHENDQEILKHCPIDPKEVDRYQAWGARIAEWLTSTNHIHVRYGVQYDGVEIERLSPGTRGIVLLLLYLSIDQNDDRPLIIDQPEENLDPKSIYRELVHRFRDTRIRRQIVIVTHNANLVVNTDADQVIVAEAGAHVPGRLPNISYRSGGLENPEIRELVCEILEGGRTAFQNRAKRLHMSFE
jgi:AAA domain, putative AbiEii toxin, Type IV TA system